MMKRIIALVVGILVIVALVPVFAEKGNVTKEMWDLSGLSFDWIIENPNDDGYDAYHSLQIDSYDKNSENYILTYNIAYDDAEGYVKTGRHFTAEFPVGKFDLITKTGDTLHFAAELTGTTIIEDGDYEDENEIVEETIAFDFQVTIGESIKVLGIDHMKSVDLMTNSNIRSEYWQATMTGKINNHEVVDIEGGLTKLVWSTKTIGQVEPDPEPEPEPESATFTTGLSESQDENKSNARDTNISALPKENPNKEVGRIFQITAGSIGTVEIESETESIWYTYDWYLDIHLDDDIYMISIVQSDYKNGYTSRVFGSEIPASMIDVPSSLTETLTLNLAIPGSVYQTTTIWHDSEDPDESYVEQKEETIDNVWLNLDLTFNLTESGSGKSVMKVTSPDYKILRNVNTLTFEGMPSGTITGMPGLGSAEENIGVGYFGDVTIGDYTIRTKGL